jgi:hypothetical protein
MMPLRIFILIPKGLPRVGEAAVSLVEAPLSGKFGRREGEILLLCAVFRCEFTSVRRCGVKPRLPGKGFETMFALRHTFQPAFTSFFLGKRYWWVGA